MFAVLRRRHFVAQLFCLSGGRPSHYALYSFQFWFCFTCVAFIGGESINVYMYSKCFTFCGGDLPLTQGDRNHTYSPLFHMCYALRRRTPQDSRECKTHTYIHTYTHIYIYIYIYWKQINNMFSALRRRLPQDSHRVFCWHLLHSFHCTRCIPPVLLHDMFSHNSFVCQGETIAFFFFPPSPELTGSETIHIHFYSICFTFCVRDLPRIRGNVKRTLTCLHMCIYIYIYIC